MEKRVIVASSELGCSTTGNSGFTGSPVCILVIPNSLLFHLHEEGNGYIRGINSCISGHLVSLNPSCSRIESALRRIAGKLVTKRKNCKGLKVSAHSKNRRAFGAGGWALKALKLWQSISAYY